MSLQSFGLCPWCGARIGMKKQSGVFICPVCSCEFKHNWHTWAPCLVGAVVVSLIVFKLIPIPVLAVAISVFLIGLVASFLGPYIIISKGRDNVTEEEISAHIPKKKESKWFIALVLLIAILTLLFLLSALRII